MEKIYCGVDLSLSSTGLVILRKDGINDKEGLVANDFAVTILEKRVITSDVRDSIEDRLIKIFDSIWLIIEEVVFEEIEKNEDLMLNIEGLSYASTSSKYCEIAGLHYYIRVRLRQKNINFNIVPPSTLKKFVSGKGNCKKELILLNIYKKWGEFFEDNNIADAYSLARYAIDREEDSLKINDND